MKYLKYIFIFFILFLTGCATILTGTKDRVFIGSKPDKAKIYIVHGEEVLEYLGETPMNVVINRSLFDKYILLRKNNFEDKKIKLEKEFNVFYIGNIVFWPGLIIDAVSSSMFYYYPDKYFILLEEKKNN